MTMGHVWFEVVDNFTEIQAVYFPEIDGVAVGGGGFHQPEAIAKVRPPGC